MRIKVFADVWVGCQPQHVFITTSPGVKTDGARRISWTLEIPDRFIEGEVDHDGGVVPARMEDDGNKRDK